MSQPHPAQQPPAAAAAAGRAAADQGETTISRTTDDGVPVGAADADADARRSGAGGKDDEHPADVLPEGGLRYSDVDQNTDDGVPVGAADAEADRLRATGQDAT